MKIGLSTIYKCYNFGSFYQAYGLQRFLEEEGHRVSFLPLDDAYNLKYRLRKQFNRDIKRDFFSLASCLAYMSDWRLLNIAKKNDSDFDMVIIGSDEIWNINNRSFTPAGEYYGLGLPAKNAFCYATSVGRSTVSDFKDRPDLLDGIKNLQFVSARDSATKELLKALFPDADIPRVIDPSFLVDWTKIGKSADEHNYILVYTYDGSWGFSDEYIKTVKEFATRRGLPLVSVGFKNDWCDRSVAASPREFLGYLKNASVVITDTFHGAAMSVQYKKQFVSMGQGKAKVEDLLDGFGLSERIYKGAQSLDEILSDQIDYSVVDKAIAEKTAFSKDFIRKSIEAFK